MIIAEIGTAHSASFEKAKQLIDAAACAGAWRRRRVRLPPFSSGAAAWLSLRNKIFLDKQGRRGIII